MVQGATLGTMTRGRSISQESSRRVGISRAVGGALLVALYGVTVCASVGLFRTPSTDEHRAACVLLGLIDVAVLPLLVLSAAIAIRRMSITHEARRLPTLVIAPLWASFIVSLLTVPLGMGMANSAQADAPHAAFGASATFLLAPWGFMLAYGLALLIVCAMAGFFPAGLAVTSQPEATA